MHLGLNVRSFAHDCGCVVNGSGAMAALLTLGAHAQRVPVVVSCVCACACACVRLSPHAILAVRATKSITKDTIVLSVRFAAILKWRFS